MSQAYKSITAEKDSLIALGSNVSDDLRASFSIINDALCAVRDLIKSPLQVSQFYKTPCFPAGAGPDFVNACVRIKTECEPHILLGHLHDIERDFGRTRDARWGQRSLDLDLIACGNVVLPSPQQVLDWIELPLQKQKTQAPDHLILPHPRLQDRAFALVPLCDVAPDWIHPVLGKTAREMLDALKDSDVAAIKPFQKPEL